MAIWQFHVIVVPEEKILKKYKCIPDNVNEVEDIQSWEGYSLDEFTLVKMSETLKFATSWADNIKQFGALDKNCIELFYDNNQLIEISLRLDLRDITIDIIKLVIDFTRQNKALLITNNGHVIKPVIENLIKVIKESDAYSFVKNPKEFLDKFENAT